MRHAGRITQWNDERGFGFVTPNGGGDRVFVHIKAFERGSSRPVEGQLVSWEPHKDERGRWNAIDVRFVDLRRARKHGDGVGWPRKTVAILCMAALAAGWLSGKLPPVVALAYAALSALAIVLYVADKSAATRQRWRTPESTLHLVALLGGWPGALFAQGAFRHKSRKAGFQAVFFATVVLNCAALAGVLGGFDRLGERFGGIDPMQSVQSLLEHGRSALPTSRARAIRVEPATRPAFSCDGRTHCSQMTSCAEATYFIEHCPNTRMDGDGDGVPCERQWCG